MVPSRTRAYLWSQAINGSRRPWQGNLTMEPAEARGDVKLQVEEWDVMEDNLSLQKLQLTLPEQYEERDECENDGKAIEVWPMVEGLNEDDLDTLEEVLQVSSNRVGVCGLVQGTDEEWGENQPLVDQLRAALLKDYGDTVLCGKFNWKEYKLILTHFLNMKPTEAPHQKQRVKILAAILNSFHFVAAKSKCKMFYHKIH